MAKVSKNQRTVRARNAAKNMVKVVVAEKKANGHYSFKQKMVPGDSLQEELRAARA